MKKVIVVIVSVLMLAVIVASVLKKNNMLNKESIEKVIKSEEKNENDNDNANNGVGNGEDAEGNIKFENRGDITDRDVIPRYGLNERVEIKAWPEDETLGEGYVMYETIEKVEMLEKIDVNFEEKDGLGGCLEEDGTVKPGVKLCAVTMKLENPNNVAVKFNREKISIVDKGAEYNLQTDDEPEYTSSTRLFDRKVGDIEYIIRPQHDGCLILKPGEIIEREIVYECNYNSDGAVLVNLPDMITDGFEGVSVVDIR